MDNNSKIDSKVNEVMNSFDNINRAEPTLYFYTRLMARVLNKKETVWERWSSFIAKPVSIITCICLVIILNVTAIFYRNAYVSQSNTEPALSEEYTQLATNLYDIENINPK